MSALKDRCTCGHLDEDHIPAERWRCSVCTCNGFDWDMDGDTRHVDASLRDPAAEDADAALRDSDAHGREP